jgi:hypothetical protein
MVARNFFKEAPSRGALEKMQEINSMRIYNDIFVISGLRRDKLHEALGTAFDIPLDNVFFNDESTRSWTNGPQSAFAYSYDKGDIGWRLDVFCSVGEDPSAQLREFALLAGVPVFYDRLGKQYDDHVDAYTPDLLENAAELKFLELAEDDVSIKVRWMHGMS